LIESLKNSIPRPLTVFFNSSWFLGEKKAVNIRSVISRHDFITGMWCGPCDHRSSLILPS